MRCRCRTGVLGMLGVLAVAVPAALAADTVRVEAERLARDFLARTPVAVAPAGLTRTAAYAVQREFVRAIGREFGAPVGYKAALTSPAARERFGVPEPMSGMLLHRMLREDGATLPAAFGARPAVEADLMVRVRSGAINRARTPGEALAALDAVIPFLELPDLVYAPEANPDGAALAAVNAGARYGVLGRAIPLAASPTWMERLGTFRAVLEDGDGKVVGEASGSALLGHPLGAVLWLRDEMNARGIALRAGDLLSLGTLVAPVPAAPGAWRVRYEGLDPTGAEARVGVTLTE